MAVKASDTITLVKVTDGTNGKGIKSYDVEFYSSTSNTALSGGSWVTTAPAWVNGKYIWSRNKIAYTDNTSVTTKEVCITGGTGSNGGTGATGTGVESITEEYYLSTSKTARAGGSWVTTPPTWSSGKYMWSRVEIVYKNPASTAYTTPVCDSSWEAVNEIEFGGKNMAEKTNQGITKWSWSMQTGGYAKSEVIENEIKTCKLVRDSVAQTGWSFFSYSDIGRLKWEANTEYCLSMDVKSSVATVMNANFMEENGLNKLANLVTTINKVTVANQWTKLIWIVKSLPTLPSSITQIAYISGMDSSAGVSYQFKNFKLEKGNKPTDWTPAPEDVDNAITDSNNSLLDTMHRQDSEIVNSVTDNLNQALANYVQNGDYNEYKESVKAQLEILGDSINMNFTTTTESINTVNGEVAKKFNEWTKYIRFGNNGIEIGEEKNALKLSLDNDIIKFVNNGKIIGYWDGTNFHTGNIIIDVTEKAQFGNFAYVPRSDGSLMFLKVDSAFIGSLFDISKCTFGSNVESYYHIGTLGADVYVNPSIIESAVCFTFLKDSSKRYKFTFTLRNTIIDIVENDMSTIFNCEDEGTTSVTFLASGSESDGTNPPGETGTTQTWKIYFNCKDPSVPNFTFRDVRIVEVT